MLKVVGGSSPLTAVLKGFPAVSVRRTRRRLLLVFLTICHATPAAAQQVGTTLSVANDDVFRGYSLSGGRPVATGEISYDDLGGFYVGGSATGVATRRSGVELLGLGGYAGYARRIGNGPTLDLGVAATRYTRWYSGNRNVTYTEVYAGIITSRISSHIRYSPDYFGTGHATVYADVDGVLRPLDKWRLTGHVGTLIQASGPTPPGADRARFDWQLGVTREVGRFDLQVGLAGAASSGSYYDGRTHGRSSLLIGAAYAF